MLSSIAASTSAGIGSKRATLTIISRLFWFGGGPRRAQAAGVDPDLQGPQAEAVGRQHHLDPQRDQGPGQEDGAERAVGLGGGRLAVRDEEAGDDGQGGVGPPGHVVARPPQVVGAGRDDIFSDAIDADYPVLDLHLQSRCCAASRRLRRGPSRSE